MILGIARYVRYENRLRKLLHSQLCSDPQETLPHIFKSFLAFQDLMQALTSIRKSQVPSYLHTSELYLSLNGDDDEAISVPSDCMKMKADVRNNADLENLLLTMRYWILAEFPIKVIRYLLCPVSGGLLNEILKPINFEAMRLLQKYQYTFPTILQLVPRLHASPSYSACILCAEYGRLDFLKYHVRLKRPVTAYTLQVAADNGHADCLSYCYRVLRSRNIRVALNEMNWSVVVQNNHLSCLSFLVKHKVSLRKLLDLSIKTGSFQCIPYLHKQHHADSWVSTTMVAAVEAGHYELIKQLHEHGCPWDESALLAAVRADQPRILEYLLRHSAVPMIEQLLQCPKQSLECVMVIMLHAFPKFQD